MSLLHLFSLEAETQTALLNDGLLTLERDPQHAESLEALMRAAHSLKGAARIVQLGAAERVAHVMEDCFVAAQEGRLVVTGEHIEVLLQGVDVLTRLAQAATTDAAAEALAAYQPEVDAQVAALRAIVTPGDTTTSVTATTPGGARTAHPTSNNYASCRASVHPA